jgi:hypothetical protein
MAKAAAPYLHARLVPRAEDVDEKPVGDALPEQKRLARYEANIIAGKFGNPAEPK